MAEIPTMEQYIEHFLSLPNNEAMASWLIFTGLGLVGAIPTLPEQVTQGYLLEQEREWCWSIKDNALRLLSELKQEFVERNLEKQVNWSDVGYLIRENILVYIIDYIKSKR